MKKIVLFIDNLGPGGAQRQLVNMGLLLKERGYDVSMMVYYDIPFYKKMLDDANIPVKLIQNDSIFSRIVHTRKALIEARAAVVIAFMETPGFLACLTKCLGGRFKLITNELSAKASTFNSPKNKIYNIFERYSDAKICNSENAMDMWRKHYPQYNEKYGVIYNPVIIPDKLLQASPQRRPNEKFRITVAASYQLLKNPLRVIDAVSLLDAEHQNKLDLQWYGKAEVTLGNRGVYEQAQAMVLERGLTHCVHLNQETDQIYTLMKNSDAVGLFSTVEGLPNAICEGMALGKPIIMSRVSDYRTLTEGNGFSCDPHSTESIRDALMQLLDAPAEQLEEMGRNSAQKAEKLFSKKAIIGQWIDLIEKLTEQN